MSPVIFYNLIVGFIASLQGFVLVLIMTNGGPANATQTISTLSYQISFRQFDFGAGAALGNVLVLISLAFAVIYLRANRRAVDE
jgi:multiple sugar transport system permease protein